MTHRFKSFSALGIASGLVTASLLAGCGGSSASDTSDTAGGGFQFVGNDVGRVEDGADAPGAALDAGVEETPDTGDADITGIEAVWVPAQLSFDPAAPKTADDFRIVVTAPAVSPTGEVDDGPYTFAWERNGAAEVLDGSVVPAALTTRGDVWRVVVTPVAPGAPSVEASVVIANSPPACASATLSPEAGTSTTTFECRCDDRVDDDGDPAVDHCQFILNGEALPGTSCTLAPGSAGQGDRLACTVTPSDADISGEPVNSASLLLTGGPPTPPTGVAVQPEAPSVSSTLTCAAVPGVDPDGEAVTLEITWVVGIYDNPQWLAASVLASTLEKAPGVPVARGDAVRCRVRSVSSEFSSPVVSEPVTLVNAPPQGGAVLVTAPNPATEASTLTCVAVSATDADGDEVTWKWAWTIEGVPIAGADGPTLDGAAFDEGDTIRCIATPFDGDSVGEAVVSKNTIAITNSPPTLAAAEITPGEGKPTDTFTCSASGWSDPDPGDPPTYAYEWLLDEQVVPGAALATLVPGAPGALRCRVRPVDEDGLGEPVDSPLAVVTAPPTLTAPVVSVKAPSGADGTVTCSIDVPASGASDITLGFTWTVGGGAPFQGASTLPASAVAACQVVTCQATATSGAASAASNVAASSALPGAECQATSLCSTPVCDPATQACVQQPLTGDPTPCTAGCPSADTCFTGWAAQGGKCPAPVITKSYVANGCFGTTGWFIEGANFQFEKDNVGIADYGPKSIGVNGDQKHWNMLTTTKLCVTIGPSAWTVYVGNQVYVRNPDGKSSNCVVIQNQL